MSNKMYTEVGLYLALYRLSRLSPGISASVEISESFATDFDWVRISLWVSTILISMRSPSFSLMLCRKYVASKMFRVCSVQP